MNKRGTTLIEAAISIFIVAVIVVTFLEALDVGINGTMQLSRKTSALNLARSQMEYVKAQEYNNSTGDLGDVYGVITETTTNISDTVNYVISGQVANVSANQSLQKITVNVSYLTGKQVQLIGYMTDPESTLSQPQVFGQLVTDVIEDMPFLPTGGFWLWGTWCGYYHVVETGATGNISATWQFNWHRDVPNLASAGSPWIMIFGPDPATGGAPVWATRDYLGNVYPDGIICRGGSLLCAGCPPAPNGTCADDHYGDYAPIAQLPPYDCVSYAAFGVLECISSATCGIDSFLFPDNWEWCTESVSWYDDHNCDDTCPLFINCNRTDQYFEFTVATESAQPAGTYTVLFFNGETTISFETLSATVTYVH